MHGSFPKTPDEPSRVMTYADLPPRDTTRWIGRRKASVVAAVQNGLISLDDACARYRLSVEEFLSWERALARHGVPGLCVTHAPNYRNPGGKRR